MMSCTDSNLLLPGWSKSRSSEVSMWYLQSPVRANQAGVQCDVCDYWLHKRCMSIADSEYEFLQHSDEPWCCPPCLKEALPFHNCSTISTISSCSNTSSLSSADHAGNDPHVSPSPRQFSLFYTTVVSVNTPSHFVHYIQPKVWGGLIFEYAISLEYKPPPSKKKRCTQSLRTLPKFMFT